MTIKELKEKIANLPDEMEVLVDYNFLSGELGWSSEETEETGIVETETRKWEFLDIPGEFVLRTYNTRS